MRKEPVSSSVKQGAVTRSALGTELMGTSRGLWRGAQRHGETNQCPERQLRGFALRHLSQTPSPTELPLAYAGDGTHVRGDRTAMPY